MPPSAGVVPGTLGELLADIVDYAGLFPPAQLSMREAVRNYAEYRTGPHAWMLGRFVVPVARLDEFGREAAAHLSGDAGREQWRIAALIGASAKSDFETILEFNRPDVSGAGAVSAPIDVVELKVERPEQIESLHGQIPAGLRAFFEFPLAADPAPFVDVLGRRGYGAKARTGGVSSEAFPTAGEVARFLHACVAAGVWFKVTAGLHHPIRGEYPLTYEPGSACGTMFGYLNVFLAASLLVAGASREDAGEALAEASVSAFEFGDTEIRWRGRAVSLAEIRASRRLAAAFGSCSFREPVDELVAAGALV